MSSDAVVLLKEHLNLVDVVGRYAQLNKRGNRVTACCPLHQEKTPSFHIDAQKGLYHCFGCGSGGDMIKFIQEMENLAFVEALDFLGELAGIELPRNRGRGPSRDLVEQLRAINLEAVKFFQNQLQKSPQIKEYLSERGISEATSKLFRLGYADNRWDGLFEHLRSQFETPALMQSGLFKVGKQGTAYDIFRERIIFPISDAFGHVIAFGGRLLPNHEGPKYINSPETPLYTKGKHLYNMNFAKPFLKRDPNVVVVEGYMDAIQVYQAGVGGVIASLGTAFTEAQAKLIKRYANRVTLNFDGDRAGFKAARASIETCLKCELEVGIVRLPEGLDPDDFLRKQGIDPYRDHLKNAESFLDFLTAYLGEGGRYQEDPHLRSVLVQELCSSLRHLTDPVVRNFYLEKASEELRVPLHVFDQVLKRQAETVSVAAPARQQAPPAQNALRFSHIERKLVYFNMHQVAMEEHLDQEQRETLPRILANIFKHQPWLLEFLYSDQSLELQERLKVIPDNHRPYMLEIFFSEGLQHTDAAEIKQLYFDLLKTMFEKLQENNRQIMAQLDPSEEVKRHQIMRQNFRYRQELGKLEELIRSGNL